MEIFLERKELVNFDSQHLLSLFLKVHAILFLAYIKSSTETRDDYGLA